LVNDTPLGRSVDEALRMVNALQHYEKHGEVCPADWNSGKSALKDNTASLSNYMTNRGKIPSTTTKNLIPSKKKKK